jgi:hypothetical protein
MDLSHITYLQAITSQFDWGHPCRCYHCKRDDYRLRFETEDEVNEYERQFNEQGRINDESGIARLREVYERKRRQQDREPQAPSKEWLDQIIARSSKKKWGAESSPRPQLPKGEQLVFDPWRGLVPRSEATKIVDPPKPIRR